MLTTRNDVATITPESLHRALAAWEARQRHRLLDEARHAQLEVEPDPVTGGWAVRSPRRPGYVEIVTEGRCTCGEYAVVGNCPHSALVASIG